MSRFQGMVSLRGLLSALLAVPFLLLVVVLLPLLILLKLVLLPFEKPLERSRDEVAEVLRKLVAGEEISDGDWDEFINVPIADPELEQLREKWGDLWSDHTTWSDGPESEQGFRFDAPTRDLAAADLARLLEQKCDDSRPSGPGRQ